MSQTDENLIEIDVADPDDDGIVYRTTLSPQELDKVYADPVEFERLVTKLRAQNNNNTTEPPAAELPLIDASANINSKASTRTKWTTEATKLMVTERLNMERTFNAPKSKKSKLWDKVSRNLFEVGGYEISGPECNDKFRNLLQTYKSNKEKRHKTTGEGKITWEFYDLFDAVLGSKSAIIPPDTTLSTSIETDVDVSAGPSTEHVPAVIQKEVGKRHDTISLSHYLYQKDKRDRQVIEVKKVQWEELKAIKLKEVDAINALAAAFAGTQRGKRRAPSSDEDE